MQKDTQRNRNRLGITCLTRPSVVGVVGLLGFFALPLSADEVLGGDQQKKPNIVFLLADDWGWGDLSCHGHKDFKTPNLDRMVAEGSEFTQFNVCSPVCSSSRAAVMTGHFPSRHHVHEHFARLEQNKERGMPDWLSPKLVILPRLFKQAGYQTAHFGKWHLTSRAATDAPPPTKYGYHESAVFNGTGPQVSASDASTYDKAIDFIKRNKDRPFFINVWMHETHTPHFPKPEFTEKFKHLSEREKVYAAIVAEGDHGVGRIMQTLDQLGLSQKTLLVFSSDNGPESAGKGKRMKSNPDGLGTYYSVGSSGGLRGRKRSLYEGGVRVPFVVRWPGVVPAGKKNENTVIAAVDLLPTFCKVAGIELPMSYEPDGENLEAALRGEELHRKKEIYWYWTGQGKGDNWPRLAVRDGDWKLVMAGDGSQQELYHIPDDRGERNDLSAKHPEMTNKLARKAKTWEKTLPRYPPKHGLSKLRR